MLTLGDWSMTFTTETLHKRQEPSPAGTPRSMLQGEALEASEQLDVFNKQAACELSYACLQNVLTEIQAVLWEAISVFPAGPKLPDHLRGDLFV